MAGYLCKDCGTESMTYHKPDCPEVNTKGPLALEETPPALQKRFDRQTRKKPELIRVDFCGREAAAVALEEVIRDLRGEAALGSVREQLVRIASALSGIQDFGDLKGLKIA